MKEFVKKYEVWVFLVLGPIANLFFVYGRSQDIIPSYIYSTGRFCVLFLVLAVIIIYTRGFGGIKDLFKPMSNWKVQPKWFILSLLFALTIVIITLLLKGIYNGTEDITTYIQFRQITTRGYFALLIWAFLGEVVWVSYSIRELLKITKPFYASQIVGLFWTLWFIPIAILGEGIFPNIPIPSLFIFIMAMAGMCTFVYEKTKSGLCVLALQYMLNLALAWLPATPTNGGVATFTAFSIIYYLVMLGFVYFSGQTKKLNLIKVSNR